MTYEGSSIDPAKPSIARVYDYLLGGKDNYAVDREIGDVFKRDLPGSVAIAFANRAALTRAVREIAKNTGIRQFIDLGSGLPTADNVHQVAQRHAPESRVVYVDTDLQVLVHGRALLETNDRTRVIAVDVRNPEGIHAHPDTLEIIDFARPVAVILSAILHHVNDDEDPAGIVRYWRDHVPSGSYFFISHFRSGNNPETAEAEKGPPADVRPWPVAHGRGNRLPAGRLGDSRTWRRPRVIVASRRDRQPVGQQRRT
ncbi:O-methyltransferase involved in polyketide biosynthesis [Streptomyces phaeoluteigriseus]